MADPTHPSIEEIYEGSSSISLVVMDEGGTILSANGCFHRTACLGEGEACGRRFPELLHGTHEADRQEWLARRMSTPTGLTAEDNLLRSDGAVVPVRHTCIPVATSSGRRLYCWGRDVSEERFMSSRAADSASHNRALAEGILALSLCRTEDELMQVLLGRAAALFPASHWALGHVIEVGGALEAVMKAATPALEQHFGHALLGMHIPIVESQFSRRLYQEREISFVKDNDAEPGQLNPLFVDAYGVRSFLGVPLMRDSQVVGALYAVAFRGEEPLAPSEGQLAGLQSLGRVGAIVWHRLLVERKLQDQVDRVERLNRQLLAFQAAASEVAQDQDLGRLLRVLMEMVAGAAHIDACELYGLDENRSVLHRLAHTGLPPELVALHEEIPLEGEGRALSGEAASRGVTVIVPDIQAFPRAQANKEPYLQAGFHSGIAIPLKGRRGAILGTFTATSRSLGEPSGEALAQMEYFASLAAMALDRVNLDTRLQEELTQRSQSESLYRTLVEESLQGVYLIQDGAFRYVSPALVQMFGGVPGLGVGMPVSEVIHEEDLPFVAENMRRRLEGEVAMIRSTFRVRRLDGTIMPVEVQGSRVTYEGRPAILGVIQDMRERLAAQEALHKSVEQARLLANAAQAFTLTQDEGELLQALFQGARNITGLPHWWHNRFDVLTRASLTTHWSPDLEDLFTPEEIQAPIPLDEYPMRVDLHLNKASIWLPDCREVPEFPADYVARVPHRSLVAVPMVQGGAAVGVLFGGTFGEERVFDLGEDQIGALRSLAISAGLALSRLRALKDVAAREAEYRQLFDQAAEAILIAEVDGVWVRVNHAACRLFGFESSEIVGQRVGFSSPEIQPDGTPTRDVLAMLRKFGKEGRSGGFDFTAYRKDGSLIHTELSIAPLFQEGQTLVQVVLRDRTEAKRAADEKAVLERQLFEAQKMESLGVVASGVAHDFNNLLMGVLGNAGLVLEDLGPSHPLANHIQAIQAAAHRATDLTRQLLAFTGRGQFFHDELDLSMEVRETRQLLETGLAPNVSLELDLAPELPVVQGDHAQIQQVLANLLINAAEAIGERPGWIKITTTPLRLDAASIAELIPGQDLEPGSYVRLEVRDSGAGMDEATLNKIFEPFFTTKFQGRGLGLSAVQGIVRGHGGGVRVDSRPGQGTCCAVYFPANTSEGAQDSSHPETGTPAAPPRRDGAR